MDVKNEKGVVFWDRLDALIRVKQDGTEITKGGSSVENVLRISRLTSYSGTITAYFKFQQLLNATIRLWPEGISADGLTIELWLDDFSGGRKGFRRKFLIKFLNELAGSLFFHVYIAALPKNVKGPTYWELRFNGSSARSDSESDDTLHYDSEESDQTIDLVMTQGVENKQGFDDDGGIKLNQKEGETSIDDEEKVVTDFLAELGDMNFGESQDQFATLQPFDH